MPPNLMFAEVSLFSFDMLLHRGHDTTKIDVRHCIGRLAMKTCVSVKKQHSLGDLPRSERLAPFFIAPSPTRAE